MVLLLSDLFVCIALPNRPRDIFRVGRLLYRLRVGRGSDYQSPNCFLDPDHDKMWILMIGDVRTGETFQTQEEGFMVAAYRHAEGTCIFPFTFYLDSE